MLIAVERLGYSDPQLAMDSAPDPFLAWNAALQNRHLASLTFQEVRRSVQALSASYVENRERLASGSVLNGAGKRAAFAIFYAPLHYLLVREIVRALNAADTPVSSVLDFGCGTGAAGAAWALHFESPPKLIGVDVNAWAIQETQWTYQNLGLQGIARRADIRTLPISSRTAVLAAFTVNELDEEARAAVLQLFLKANRDGSPVLVVEPIARRLTKWWDDWAKAFETQGGRTDQWRFQIDLPENLKLMDKAAGLDHRELTGRSLWIAG